MDNLDILEMLPCQPFIAMTVVGEDLSYNWRVLRGLLMHHLLLVDWNHPFVRDLMCVPWSR